MLRSCLSSTFLQLVHGCSAWMVSANESIVIAEQCCHSIVILKALVFPTVYSFGCATLMFVHQGRTRKIGLNGGVS